MKKEELYDKIVAEADRLVSLAVGAVAHNHDKLVKDKDYLARKMNQVRKDTVRYIANRSLKMVNLEAAKGLDNAMQDAARDAKYGRLDEAAIRLHTEKIKLMRRDLVELLDAAGKAPRTDGQTGGEFRHRMQEHLFRDTMQACRETLADHAEEISRMSAGWLQAAKEEPYMLKTCHIMATWDGKMPSLRWPTRRIGNRYAKSSSIRSGAVVDSDISAVIILNQEILVMDRAALDLAELVADLGEENGRPELSVLHRSIAGSKKDEIDYIPHSVRPIDHDIRVTVWRRPEYFWLLDYSDRSGGLDEYGPLAWVPFDADRLLAKADYYADQF